MKKITTLIIILLFSVIKSVSADEVLIKVANIDGRVLENYRGIGLNIFSRNDTFSKYLGRALGSGVVPENSGLVGRKYIDKSSLIDCELNEASPDIAGALPLKAMISGRQNSVAVSAWKKYILHFPLSGSYREGVFEIKPARNIDKSAKVSCVAVKNNRGIIESWRITDMIDSNVYSEKVALRMDRALFMQKLWGQGGADWLLNLLPPSETVSAIVLEQNGPNELGGTSDSILLFVRPGNGDMGVTHISMVIGWRR